jgi:hypothetical protein
VSLVKYFLSIIIIINLSLVVLNQSFLQETYAQQGPFVQDLRCAGCVDLLPEEIELHKDLFPITIWTDAKNYDHNSVITVNGFLRPENTFNPVTLTVSNPIGNIVTIDQITPQPNGDFSIRLNTAGNLWKSDGSYIIKAQSGGETRVFKTSVLLTSGIVEQESRCGLSEFSANGNCISYSITGGKITGANIDSVKKSLKINLVSEDGGTLNVNPSSSIINGIFMVQMDGKVWDNTSIQGNSVTILFPEGTHEIEIIGTFVIPEFGHLAIIILAITITAMIVLNRKIGLPVLKL